MRKRYLATLATLLIGAGAASAQGQDVPGMLPMPQQLPPPQAAPAPAAEGNFWDEFKSSCLGQLCCQSGRMFSADAAYVLWFLANGKDSVPLADTDFLSQRDAAQLPGVSDADHDRGAPISGVRLALGYWQVQDNEWVPGGIRDWGVETVFFFVGQHSINVKDDTFPTIIRPFFDLNNRQESGFIVAQPGLDTGYFTGHAQLNVWGSEINVWKNVYYNCPGTTCNVSMLAGLRYLDLDERLNLASVSVYNANLAAFPAFIPFEGNSLVVGDSFATHNHFYGGQVGVNAKWYPFANMIIDGTFKLGVGATHEDLEIAGGQLRTLPNGTQMPANGGLLALPTNMGNFHADHFAQVPELDLKFSDPILPHLTLSLGFDCIYWSRILRPAQQIDRDIDITQIPNFPTNAGVAPTGLNQPSVPFRQSDLWILGITLSAEVTW
jgi:Putative beta barrel porin-7 (BBP7)